MKAEEIVRIINNVRRNGECLDIRVHDRDSFFDRLVSGFVF